MSPRALFLNPPLILGEDFIDYPWFAGYGVLASAALVARAGWEVDASDSLALPGSGRFDRPEGGSLLGVPHGEYLGNLPLGPYDLVVIGSTPFLRIGDPAPETRQLVDDVLERYPAATIVLADCHTGGMHYADYDAGKVLDRHPGLDAVIKYSGEQAFSDPSRITRLKGRGTVVENPEILEKGFVPPYPLFEAIDTEASGAFLWRTFADGSWTNTFGVDAATRPFMTSTGCPHRCVFCSSNPGWKGKGRKPYRTLPVPVVEQWAYLTSRLSGARKLFILDEMANARPDFDEVLAVLNRLGLLYEFPNGLRADRLSKRTFGLLKDHISLLSISAETADQDDLDKRIGKHLDLVHVEQAARDAMEAGVPAMVHFIVGFPWETPGHVQRTLEMAWKLYEKYGASPSVQFATPLPGTRLHESCIEKGLIPESREPVDLDGGLFQHRPAFPVPGLPEGYLETATATLRQKIDAHNARKVIINVTYECINQCVFCAVSNRVRKDIPWSRLSEMIREHRDRGFDQLDLDGGEPTMHGRLLDAVRLARQIGYNQVNVTTNGRRLKDGAVTRGLMESGITSLLISLHGHTARVHDRSTRVRGSFEETMAGLRNVMKWSDGGVDFGVNTTITRHNVKYLGEFADLLWEEGVRKVNFQFLTPFGAACGPLVPPVEDAAGAVMAVIDRYRGRMNLQVINAQFCFFPGYEQYLAGDVQKLGRQMVFVTDEEVNLFNYLADRRAKEAVCSDCAWALICEGFHVFGQGESDVEP